MIETQLLLENVLMKWNMTRSVMVDQIRWRMKYVLSLFVLFTTDHCCDGISLPY